MKPRNSSNGHFSKSSYHQQQNHYAQQPQYQQQHNTTGHFPSNHKSTATAAASVSTTPASTLKSIDPSLKEKFNFDYLRRKDPKVVKILHTFDHIVLYKVNEAGEWSKESVEGSMFVVERENNELPLMQSYRFVVMNRRSTENYFQEITPALELQLNSPFVLYRDGTTDDIRGLWFYNTLQSLYFVDAVNNIIEKLRTSATEHNYQHEGEMHQHPEQLHYHQHVDMSHQSYAPTLSTENVNEAATNLLKSTLGLSFGNESSAVESTDLGVPSENQSLDELEQQLLAQLNTTEPQLGVPEIPYPQQEVQNEEVKQEEQNDVMSFFKQHNINLHVMPSPQGPPSAQHEQVQAAPPPLDILKPQNLLKSLLGNTVCSDEEENEEEEHEGGESENQVAPAQLPGEVNIQEQLLQVLPAQAVASAVDKNAAFDGIHTKGDFKTMLVSMLEDSENTVLLDSLFEQFQKLRSEQGHQFIETE